MPIHALSFALDVVGGPNAASKRRGTNPSIASTSAAYEKRRGGHVDIADNDSSASLLPQCKKKTVRKKSATKCHCSSSIAQTSASKKKRS